MTAEGIHITAFGFFKEKVLGGTAVDGNRRSVSIDSAEKMRWSSVFERPCDSFRRMDQLCRFAVAAAEMLGLPELPRSEYRPDMAIVLGTRYGCFGVDAEFFHSMFRPEGASPMLFTYTLPNVAIGELAIRHRISGQNLCLSAGTESGLLAFWESFRLIERKEAAACLCLAADALPSKTAEHLKGPTDSRETAVGHAYAFLLESESYQRKTGHLIQAEIGRSPQPPEYFINSTKDTILPGLCRFLAGESRKEPTYLIPSPNTLQKRGGLHVIRPEQTRLFPEETVRSSKD
jgi:hypothetical protein